MKNAKPAQPKPKTSNTCPCGPACACSPCHCGSSCSCAKPAPAAR